MLPWVSGSVRETCRSERSRGFVLATELINQRLGCCRHIYLCLQKDSWAIDYQATLNTLNAARKHGASHFVLLSAICVQKPLLEFQHAKLKFEETLQSAGDITYSIVRPTAFFKSLAGQVIFLQSSECTWPSHAPTE